MTFSWEFLLVNYYLQCTYSHLGLWIRIHFLRIRIQLCFSMRIRIQQLKKKRIRIRPNKICNKLLNVVLK